MNTILIWLLITVPVKESSHSHQPHAHVIERFADQAECQRVGKELLTPSSSMDDGAQLQLRCIQARVVAPEVANAR